MINFENGDLEKISLIAKETYDFLEISDEDFNRILQEVFEKSERAYALNSKLPLQKVFEQVLSLELDHMTLDALSDYSTNKVFSNYIDQNINVSEQGKKNITELNKIVSFFENLQFQPDDEFFIFAIENNKINELVKSITKMKNYKNLIKKPMLVRLFDTYDILNDEQEELLSDDALKKILNDEQGELSNDDHFTCDLLKLYVNELNYPLLNAQEERELAIKMKQGSQEAREKFINSNLRLVISIAKKYQDRGLPLVDLIQEGNIGLIKAIDKFDYTKELKLSSYASWWIKHEIIRGIENTGRNIRISTHMYESIRKFNNVQEDLEKKLERKPTLKEIAKTMHISFERAKEIYKAKEDTTSLNEIIVGNEKDTELVEVIPCESQEVEEIIIQNNMKENIRKLINNSGLELREKEIIIQRFGLDGNPPQTQEAIAKNYPISRQRVDQIERKVIQKLRLSKEVDALLVYALNPTKASMKIEKERNSVQGQKLQKKIQKKAKNSTHSSVSHTKSSKSSKENHELSKKDYTAIEKMLQTPEFDNMKNRFGTKNAMVLSLKFGYKTGICFSDQTISKLLNIGEEEIHQLVESVLAQDNEAFFINPIIHSNEATMIKVNHNKS